MTHTFTRKDWKTVHIHADESPEALKELEKELNKLESKGYSIDSYRACQDGYCEWFIVAYKDVTGSDAKKKKRKKSKDADSDVLELEFEEEDEDDEDDEDDALEVDDEEVEVHVKKKTDFVIQSVLIPKVYFTKRSANKYVTSHPDLTKKRGQPKETDEYWVYEQRSSDEFRSLRTKKLEGSDSIKVKGGKLL